MHNKQLPKPSLVVFDWDNTLVDTFPLLHSAYNKMLAHFNKPLWDEATARANIRLSAKDSFPAMFGAENVDEAIAVFHAEVKARHLDEIIVIPGAKALVKKLHADHVPMGVFSNKTDFLLNAEIDHLGWRDWFGCVIGASSVKVGKPDPEGIIHVHAHTLPNATMDHTVWYVGDTETDMQAAKRAGVTAVHVTNDPMSQHKNIIEAGADYCFDTTQLLLESYAFNG